MRHFSPGPSFLLLAVFRVFEKFGHDPEQQLDKEYDQVTHCPSFPPQIAFHAFESFGLGALVPQVGNGFEQRAQPLAKPLKKTFEQGTEKVFHRSHLGSPDGIPRAGLPCVSRTSSPRRA